MVPYDALLGDPVYRETLEEAGVGYTQNGLVADLVFQNLEWKRFWVERTRAGQPPLWNPYLAGGMPFLAAGQHSGLYPPSLIFFLIPTPLAFGWNALLALWLAGLAMYAFGRVIGLGRFAAILMGSAWSLSALFVVNGVFPMIQAGMTWLPLILAGILALCRQAEAERHAGLLPRGSGAAWLLLVALATALTGLAGHPEMLLYAALVASAFSAYRLAWVWRLGSPRAALRAALWLAGAALCGGLVAALQLVPLAELAGANWRSGAASYAEVLTSAFGIRQAITFLVPDFFGNPAHHAVPRVGGGGSTRLAGNAMWGLAWGSRNYVEAAAYIGLPCLLLAPVGLVARPRRRLAVFFGLLALLALSFIFGLPSYRLLFFAVPGVDQLRTPFRWIFPFDLALVTLAGLGADHLVTRARSTRPADLAQRLALGLGWLATACGSLLGLVLALAWLRPERWTRLVASAFEALPCPDGHCALDAALERFGTPAVLADYQYGNLGHLAVFMCLGGIALLLLARRSADRRQARLAQGLALATLSLDLILVGFGFTPAVDPALADLEPPLVTQLSDLVAAKWGRVSAFGEAKLLWPNSAMRADIPDLRAYDSILPWWTVETLDAIEDQSGMLIYNRIGNLQRAESLAHPALAALGLRYLISQAPIDAPGLELVAEDGELKLYENTRALPRAWVVNQVEVHRRRADLLAALDGFDPARTALLEEAPELEIWQGLPAGRDIEANTQVRRDTETAIELQVDVFGAPSGGLLMLSEAWFPGWRAWVETAGPEGRSETEVPVYRADGMLRAVPVPPGRSTVRLKYFPMSLKIGLYGSFLGGILLILAAAYALWSRFVRVDDRDEVGRIAVNSAGPIAANLLNKLLLFVFAMLTLRLLGPEAAGQYYVAVTIIGFADIITNFGLNLLTTREVARRPELAGRYLSQTILLRLLLWLLMLPLLGGYIALRGGSLGLSGGNPLSREAVLAIGLLALGLIPSNLNTAISSIFQARERMVLPAAVTIVSTLVTISVGAVALLAGYGFVGLAAVSILTNWITFGILLGLAAREGIRPEWRVEPAFIWAMVGLSLPLMLNHMLQTVFFKIDVLLLDQLLSQGGSTVVGWYQAAYKWVDALLILPAFFTMALFPMLSRRAADDPSGFRRAFSTAQRWLITVALPIAVVTTFLADSLVWVLAGSEYVPQGGTALKVMIWFLPFSFANGLTQYVLIALNRQRWITLSFVIAVAFNLLANWLVIPGHVIFGIDIPAYSYVGAAVVTILSELVLRIPFGYGLRDVGAPPLLVLMWRPALAASVAAGLLARVDALGGSQLLGLLLALPVYGLVLALLGGITADDRALLSRLLPGRRGPATSEAPQAL
ncbi:MAG: oligosaccharide flippase family protein [Chloroflexi bacterium]|nr:oligosaccharide flippase family protein [Chloroflexota bacterium]